MRHPNLIEAEDLHRAAGEGDVVEFRRLLSNGADILSRIDDKTVLDVAEEKARATFFNGKYNAIIQAIIQHIFEKLSAFNLEASGSELAFLFFIRSYEENFPSIFPAAVLEFSDSDGRTLLHHACILNDGVQCVTDDGHAHRIRGWVNKLLSKGAPQKKDKLGNFPIHYLIQYGISFDLTYGLLLHHLNSLIWEGKEVYENAFGNSLLHCAAFYDRTDWIEGLINNQTPFYQKNHAEETFLDLAAMKGNIKIFRLILKKVRRVKEGSLEYDMIKRALLYAIYYQQISIVNHILENFRSPELVNAGFLQAIASGNVELVWKFIEKGAGVNMEGEYILGRAPEEISFNCKKPAIKLKKAMPMELACEIRSPRIIFLLLKNGAYLFRKSFFGNEMIDKYFNLIVGCMEGYINQYSFAVAALAADYAHVRAKIFQALEKNDAAKLTEILEEARRDSVREVFHATNEKGLSPVQIVEAHGAAGRMCEQVLENFGGAIPYRPIPLEREDLANDNNAPVAVIENPAGQRAQENNESSHASVPLVKSDSSDANFEPANSNPAELYELYIDASSGYEELALFLDQRRLNIPANSVPNDNNAPVEEAPAPKKKAPYLDENHHDVEPENALDEEEIAALKKLANLVAQIEERKIEDIPQKYICSFSGEIMRDPVLAGDGCNYERECVAAYLKTQKEKKLPAIGKTQKKIPHDILISNGEFRAEIIRYLEIRIADHDAVEQLKAQAQLLQSPNGQALFSPAIPAAKETPEKAEESDETNDEDITVNTLMRAHD